MKNEQLSNLLTGIGAITEVAGMLCRELLKNGFTREEAVSIAGNYVIEQFRPRPKVKGDDAE